jgi:voltage-gated potassium channel Kch
MLIRLLMIAFLLSLCVMVHALVLTTLLRRLSRSVPARRLRYWPATLMLIRIAVWMVTAHLVEIAIWASFFAWHRMFPDFETSFYFSAVTYTTVGYGDLVLPVQWRLLSGVEGLTGILMCGWSTGFLFAVVSRMYYAMSTEARTVEGRGER